VPHLPPSKQYLTYTCSRRISHLPSILAVTGITSITCDSHDQSKVAVSYAASLSTQQPSRWRRCPGYRGECSSWPASSRIPYHYMHVYTSLSAQRLSTTVLRLCEAVAIVQTCFDKQQTRSLHCGDTACRRRDVGNGSASLVATWRNRRTSRRASLHAITMVL